MSRKCRRISWNNFEQIKFRLEPIMDGLTAYNSSKARNQVKTICENEDDHKKLNDLLR